MDEMVIALDTMERACRKLRYDLYGHPTHKNELLAERKVAICSICKILCIRDEWNVWFCDYCGDVVCTDHNTYDLNCPCAFKGLV
jgi:hypothetical protein